MNYLLNDEQRDMVKITRDFCEQIVVPNIEAYDLKSIFDIDAFKEAAELGIHYPELPEAIGGAGLDLETCAAINEEIARADAGFYSALGASRLGSRPVILFGSKDQKEKAARSVMAGEIWAFALTETNAGSDAAAARTTAVHKGDEYILNGRKCFITNGAYADHMTVFATIDPEKGAKGICCFLVDRGTPGLSNGKEEDKMGIRTSNTCDIIFDDVQIPSKNLIGEEGKGFNYAMMALDNGRIDAAIGSVGIAQAAFEYAIKYAQERKTFGQAIINNQAIQFMLADMETAISVSRQQALYAVKLRAMHSPMFAKVSAQAKTFASDQAVQVCLDALQILGGYGYMREYPVEKLLRDVKIFQIYEGTNQIQRMVIAGALRREYKIKSK